MKKVDILASQTKTIVLNSRYQQVLFFGQRCLIGTVWRPSSSEPVARIATKLTDGDVPEFTGAGSGNIAVTNMISNAPITLVFLSCEPLAIV